MKLFDSEWKVMEVLWQDGDTTAKELSLLSTVFREMSSISCTLTETDLTDGTLDEETGEPNVQTKYSLAFAISLSRDASAVLQTTEEYARYKALRTGEEWDKLLSLWRGYGWVESGAGESVHTLREDVVRLALAQQGRIAYRWGGKYSALGRDALWGFPQQDEDGTIFTYGLDCSGFVAWVFVNAAGTAEASSAIGDGTSMQRSACEEITREEVQPGDLVFWQNATCTKGDRWNEIHHAGIYIGEGKVIEGSLSKGCVVIRMM